MTQDDQPVSPDDASPPDSPRRRRVSDALVVLILIGAVGGWWYTEQQKIADLNDLSDQLYHGAMIAELRGLRDEAKAQLAEALKHDTDHRLANYLMGLILAKESADLDGAMAHGQKALAADPEDWIVYEAIGLIHYKRGEFQEATDQFERGLTQKRGKNIYLYDRLGDTLWRLGVRGEALQAWRLALDPPPWEPWEQLTDEEEKNVRIGDDLFSISNLFAAREERLREAIRAKIEAVGNDQEPAVEVLAPGVER
ncbi:MAG: tetratricopeptide repeat protein [Planctomycetota bacterium]|jgi:tetratricopeptide (TPR) repeat protein